jgi:hypothetical protein
LPRQVFAAPDSDRLIAQAGMEVLKPDICRLGACVENCDGENRIVVVEAQRADLHSPILHRQIESDDSFEEARTLRTSDETVNIDFRFCLRWRSDEYGPSKKCTPRLHRVAPC